jgi:hypothetical protein
LLLEHCFVFELALAYRVEGQEAVDVDADQALERIQEEDVFYLII